MVLFNISSKAVEKSVMSDNNVLIILQGYSEPIRVTPQRPAMRLDQLADDLQTQINGVVGPAREQLLKLNGINETIFVKPSQVTLVIPEIPTS